MSLTSFVAMRDVKARTKLFRPKMPRKIGVPLKVEPRTKPLCPRRHGLKEKPCCAPSAQMSLAPSSAIATVLAGGFA